MSAIGIGSSLVFAIRSALLGPGPSDTLQKVRNLDQSNGGDFAVSILDKTKASKRFSDFKGTTADVGDSVALVVDDLLDLLALREFFVHHFFELTILILGQKLLIRT